MAQKTGRCQILPQTLYNKAWALVKRNRKEDFGEAKELANYALNVANALGYTLFAAHCKSFIEANMLV